MKTYSRQALDDRRRYLAALSAGRPDIGFGPQCLVLGSLPIETIATLCESIEALSAGLEPNLPVQFRAEIARCAKRNGAAAPDLHVRLCDAIANVSHEAESTAAALILVAVTA